ncbi:hypothetical protein GCM10009624_23430 [Gordonia sinesedis]
MAKPYRQEFRDDVVRVARDREKGVTLAQVAKDFGSRYPTARWIILVESRVRQVCR